MGAFIQVNGIEIDTRTHNEKIMKTVVQLDMNGNEIAKYHSIGEAERLTGILHIGECINKKPNRLSAGGYYWRTLEEN